MGEIKANKVEWGIGYDEGRSFIVQRPFMMRVCDGPLVSVGTGETVFVSPEFGAELVYSGKAIPCELAEFYEALRDFQTVGPDGCYIRVKLGDTLKLNRSEAIEHLRKANVKPKKGGIEK